MIGLIRGQYRSASVEIKTPVSVVLPVTSAGFQHLPLPQNTSGGHVFLLAVRPVDTLSWTGNLKRESSQQAVVAKTSLFRLFIVVLEPFVRPIFRTFFLFF